MTTVMRGQGGNVNQPILAKKAKPKPKPPNPAVNQNAHQLLVNFLNQYGLGNLAGWAWSTYVQAGGGDLGMQLVEAQLPNQAAYKARFPAIADRVAKGLAPISPTDYINYENALREAFSAHGLPLPTTGNGFNTMIHELLANNVSAAEVINQRIGSAFDRVANAPVEVQQAAERLWGLNGKAALAAYFLDPQRSAPELERLSKATEVAGTAQRFGISLNSDRSLRLADLGADENLGQFTQLGKMRPLFNENIGEDTNLTLEDQGVGAAFGESPEAELAVRKRLEGRKAATGGGGGYFESGSGAGGIAGLGEGPT